MPNYAVKPGAKCTILSSQGQNLGTCTLGYVVTVAYVEILGRAAENNAPPEPYPPNVSGRVTNDGR